MGSADAPARDTERGPFNTAWVAPPYTDLSQFTHAVTPGCRIAVCGAVTASRGGRWPEAADWDLSWPPCPECESTVKQARADLDARR